MNTSNFFKKLTDQWPAKVICLVLAIALYILHQTSLLEKKTFIVPLQVVEDGNVSVMGHIPSSVSVIVKADKNDMSKISNSDIQVSVNLSNLTDSGNYNLPLNLTFSDGVMTLDSLEVKVKPEYLSVDVEKKIVKYIQVVPSTVGEVADGYKIEQIEVNPPYVAVEGPESIVNATDSIYTTRVNVSNANKNFTVEANGYSLNRMIKLMEEGPYKVTISLGQMDMEKNYEGIAVVLTNLSDNLKIDGAAPLVNVTLSGKAPFLDKYVISRNFVTADFSEITAPGVYEIPLKYISSASFEIIKKSAEKITVTIVDKIIEEQAAAEEAEENGTDQQVEADALAENTSNSGSSETAE